MPVSNYTKSTTSGCWTSDQVLQLSFTNTEFYNSDDVDRCYGLCPIECEYVDYDLNVNSATYPSYWYQQLDSEIKSDVSVMINIYYKQMYYTLVEDTPKITLDLLVSLIGGNISLFVGMSVLSFIEFFELAWLVSENFFSK